MDPKSMEILIDNEREWRRHMVIKVDNLTEQISNLKSRSLVVEVIGGALFALMLVLIQIGWNPVK